MGSSATPQRQTQNTSSSSLSISTPPPAIVGKLGYVAEDMWDWYNRNKQAPGYFPDPTYAAMTPQTNRALEMMWSRSGGSPLVDAGQSSLIDTLGGKYLGGNPYLSDALSAEFGKQNERFRDDILPSLDAKFAGAGRTAGGAHIDTSMRMTRDLADAQADATARAVAGEYGAERGRMLQAAGLAPALAEQDYRDLEAALRVGQTIEGYDQKRIDDQIARYNYDGQAQPDWYARMAQTLQSIFPGGQTSGSANASGTTTQSGGGDGVPSWLSAVLGGLGSAARFLPTSDRRLKTDIKDVGRLHDGQKVYSYRLQGEPHHQIGLMAQEVERRAPGAVVTDPLGLKHVDYARATRSAAQRRARRPVPVGGLM